MNKLLTALLVASLAGPVLSAPALAAPGFYEEAMMIARSSAEEDKQALRDRRKARQELTKGKQYQAEPEQEEHRYGYGYERRNPERFERSRGNDDQRGRR